LRECLGVCQWFHFKDHEAVERTIPLLRELGVRHLRTGISWADYLRDGGAEWYDWQMTRLASTGVEVLLSVWHTPPSISEGNACNSPPRRLRDYADFIDLLITRYGERFGALELWNEPNNRYKWNFVDFDPGWKKFSAMIGDAAYWAKQRGRTTVLGGMIPVDPHWLELIDRGGLLRYIDVIGIHAFPGMWWPNHPNWEWHDRWQGWRQKIDSIRPAAPDKPVWVTETGLATWDLATHRQSKHDLQSDLLAEAALAPAERLYWYSLIDLDPARDAIEGFHVDENEYHMGLVTHAGKKKPAFRRLKRLLGSARRMKAAPVARIARGG
jgi:CDP-paratose 2-epimerase